jgi:hypothetical protein
MSISLNEDESINLEKSVNVEGLLFCKLDLNVCARRSTESTSVTIVALFTLPLSIAIAIYLPIVPQPMSATFFDIYCII